MAKIKTLSQIERDAAKREKKRRQAVRTSKHAQQ